MPLIAKDDRRCLIAENVLAPDCRYFSAQLALDIFKYFFSIFFSQYLSAPLASYDARGALGHVRAHKATKRQEEIWV